MDDEVDFLQRDYPPRILVVDAELESAAATADVLERDLDADTVIETDPTAVPNLIETDPFDCVVSDYDVQPQDGLELFETVRQAKPTLPFILLIDAGAEDIASDALSRGVSEYVRMGTTHSSDELVNRVGNHVGKYRAEHRLRELRTRKQQWMEVAVDGFFEYDVPADILVLSEGFDEAFDIQQVHIENGLEWFRSRIHPTDRERVVTSFHDDVEDGVEVVTSKFRFRSGTGAYRHVRCRSQLLYSDDDSVHALGVLWDVTEEVRQREQRRQSELILNNTQDATFLIGPDRRLLQVNDRVCSDLGQPREKLVGQKISAFLQLLPIDSKLETEMEEAVEQVLTGEADYRSLEVTLRWSDDDQQVVEVDFHPVTVDDDVSGVAVTSRDVTDRVRKEQTLERITEATAAFEAASSRDEIASLTIEAVEEAFDATLSAFWFVDEDREALKLADATEPTWSLLEATSDPPYIHEAGDRVWEAFQTEGLSILADLKPAEVAGDFRIETAIIVPLGDHGAISLSTMGRPLSDHDRDLIRILARSVTTALDRLVREQSLQRNRDLLAQSQRLASVGAWNYDVETDVIQTTAEVDRILRRDREQPIGLDDGLQFYHPDDRPLIRRAVKWARRYSIGFDHRVRIIRTDDTTRWVRVVGKPLTEDGKLTHIQGAIQDIDADYRRRRQLGENEHALRELHQIVADQNQTVTERIASLLDLGRERLGLSVGFQTFVDGETVEIARVVGDTTAIEQGQKMPLANTLCRNVSDSEAVVAIHDAVAQGYADDPGYNRTGFASYLGAPLYIEGNFVGTVCMADPNPRAEPFDGLEEAFVNVLVQQVSYLLSRSQRHKRLQALHDAMRALLKAESVDDIPAITTSALESIPHSPPIVFYRWDESRGSLKVASSTGESVIEGDSLPSTIEGGQNPIWDAFVQSERRIIGPDQQSGDVWDSRDCLSIVVPVAEFGVLVACRKPTFEGVDFEVDFLETVGDNIEASLAVVEKRQQIREYADKLERRNEQLERLGRINGIIRNIQRTLVESTTREDIEQTVCDNLAKIQGWELTWIGHPGVERGALEVGAASDDRASSLAEQSLDSDGEPLAARTMDRQEAVQVSNVLSADGPEPWRQVTLGFGFQSVLSVPISYAERSYGVLEIYADAPDAFTADEREVLIKLGTTIAYAIANAEQRQSLQSGRRVELDLTVPHSEDVLLSLGRTLNQEATVNAVVSRSDGTYLAYLTVADVEAAADVLHSVPVVDDVLSFGDTTTDRIEIRFESSSFLDTLSAFNAHLIELTAGTDRNRARIVLPRTDQVRDIVDHIQDSYPETKVIAQQTRDVSNDPDGDHPLAALTERQREILTVALQRGLFEWPRESSGEEVAASLDIVPATFHEHLRNAQRAIFESLLGPVD